jgi:hypothetical protein
VSEAVKCLLIPLEEGVLKIVKEKLVMGKKSTNQTFISGLGPSL